MSLDERVLEREPMECYLFIVTKQKCRTIKNYFVFKQNMPFCFLGEIWLKTFGLDLKVISKEIYIFENCTMASTVSRHLNNFYLLFSWEFIDFDFIRSSLSWTEQIYQHQHAFHSFLHSISWGATSHMRNSHNCLSLSGNSLASRLFVVTFPVYFQRQCGSFSETPLALLDMRIFIYLSGKVPELLKLKRGFILWGERKIKQMHSKMYGFI